MQRTDLMLEKDTAGFDTSRPGAPEAKWATWADTLPIWSPSPRNLVVVSPHPDDETLGAGGLIATTQRNGGSVVILSVTDGESACPEISDLGALRQHELSRALDCLGVSSTRIARVGLGDGTLASREAQIEQALDERVTDDALIVAPVDFDGHPDHEAASRAAQRVAADRGLELACYPIWAWHRGSSALCTAMRAVRFPLSTEVKLAKYRALDQFQSQTRERVGGAIVPKHVLAYFKRPYEVFLL